MEFQVEKHSSMEMKRSCMWFCIGCGSTGVKTNIYGNQEESLDQTVFEGCQSSMFLLLRSCSGCCDGKVYTLDEADYSLRIHVAVYISQLLRVAVEEFGGNVDFVEKYNDRKNDVESFVGNVVTASQDLFYEKFDRLEWTDECFAHERKVPCFWMKSMEALFHLDNVVRLRDNEDGDGESEGGVGESKDGECEGCVEDQLVRGVKLVDLDG